MKRIDTPNKAVDLFGAGKHGFRDGDQALGINPTEFNASFFNNLQEEIAGIIEASGAVLDQNNRAQLLAALRAAGVFATPAQFDNTTKAATTAFVQSIGLRSVNSSIGANATLTSADVGKSFIGGAATTFTLNLPISTTCPAGSRIGFANYNTGSMVLARQSTDSINTSQVNTSLTLGIGDTCLLETNGAGQWYVVDGTMKLKDSTVFGASLASASGYQKLPSGLIIQWGSFSTSASADVAVTFPIAFPNAARQVVTNAICISGMNVSGYNTLSVTGFNGNNWTAAATRTVDTVSYIAFGY